MTTDIDRSGTPNSTSDKEPPRHKSIKRLLSELLGHRLPWLVLAVCSCALLLVIAASFHSSVMATQASINANALGQANRIAENITAVMERTALEAGEIALHLSEQTFSDAVKARKLLDEQLGAVRKSQPEITAAAIVDESGRQHFGAGKHAFLIAPHDGHQSARQDKKHFDLANNHSGIIAIPIPDSRTGGTAAYLEVVIDLHSVFENALLKNERRNATAQISIAQGNPTPNPEETRPFKLGFEPRFSYKKSVALQNLYTGHFIEIDLTTDIREEWHSLLSLLFIHITTFLALWLPLFLLTRRIQNRLSDPMQKIEKAIVRILDSNDTPSSRQPFSRNDAARSNLLKEIVNTFDFTEVNLKQKLNNALMEVERKRALLADISKNSGVIALSLGMDTGKIIYFSEIPNLNLNFLNISHGSHWRSLLRCLDKEGRHASIEAIRILLKHGRHRFKVELPVPGGKCYFEIQLQKVMSFPRRVDMIAMDNTEKTIAEAALQSSEARKDAIVRGAINGFMTLDDELVVTYANPAAYEMLRRSPDSLEGLRFPDHCVAPGSLRVFLSYLQKVCRENSSTYGDEIQAWFRIKDGANMPVRIHAITFSAQGKTEICLYLDDISKDIAQAQEISRKSLEIDTIFSMSPGGFASFDQQGHLSAFNDSLEKIFNLGRHQIYLGMNESDFLKQLADTSKPGELHSLASKIVRHDEILSEEHGTLEVNINQGKIIRYLRRRPEGPSRGASCVYYFDDISHEHALHSRKSKFLATAAHELRTPLTTIMGFSEFLTLNKVGAQEQNELISSIHRHSVNLNSLINDLLDLEKIDSNSSNLFKLAPAGVSDFLHDTVKTVTIQRNGLHYIGEHVLILSSRLPNGLTADIDKEKLTRALLNLLNNAAKYSAPTKPILVNAYAIEVDGSPFVEITVTDQGIGMSSAELDSAFTPFWRADRGSQIATGTGLGLPLVKEIIERHNGTVYLNSVCGEGTVATIRLPAHPESKNARHRISTTESGLPEK